MTSAELGENPCLEVTLLSFTPELLILITNTDFAGGCSIFFILYTLFPNLEPPNICGTNLHQDFHGSSRSDQIEQDPSFSIWQFALGCSSLIGGGILPWSIKAVYNPTALTLVTSSIALELLQKRWASVLPQRSKWQFFVHFLGNIEGDSRKECGTKEEQQFCGFVRVQKVITLHGWVVSTRGFTSPSFQQQHLHSLVFLNPIRENVFTGKCLLR